MPIKLEYTIQFIEKRKKYVKHNIQRFEAVKKALQLLIHNAKHPSLNAEKLRGSNVWTARLNKGDRLFFIWYNENKILLIDIGPHDTYKSH